MIKTIMASAATIALTIAPAIAQEMPSAAGLTPGAPIASGPYTDEAVIAGETNPGVAVVDPASPAVAMEQPVLAQPAPGEVIGMAQGPVGALAVDPAYPSAPSPVGLTPGAPVGTDGNGNKVVAGQESGVLIR